MNNQYEKLLASPSSWIEESDPTPRLCRNVMHKIERREVGRMRRQSFGYGLLVVVVLAAFIPTFEYVSSSFALSGFSQYVSLLMTDGSYTLAHWRDLLFVIFDALPTTALTAIIALFLLTLYSLRWFINSQTSLIEHQHALGAYHI